MNNCRQFRLLPWTSLISQDGVKGLYGDYRYFSRVNLVQHPSNNLSISGSSYFYMITLPFYYRFTPPIHTMLAFLQAIQEFKQEGGLPGRAKR